MFSRSVLACAALVTAVLVHPLSAARADTYTIYDLGSAGYFNVFGIDDAGTVVVAGEPSSVCGGSSRTGACYVTYQDGVETAMSTTKPALAYDNGSRCAIAGIPKGTYVSSATCNNGHEAYGAIFTQPELFGLFDGPDRRADLVYGGLSVDGLVLNANGDIAWTSYLTGDNYEAIDLTTRAAISPEPASLALLGTGALGAVGVLRRRMAKPV